MSIPTYAAYKSAKPHARASFLKNTLTVTAARLYSRWFNNPFAGAVPTAAVVPTAATQGSLFDWPPGLSGYIKTITPGRWGGGTFIIADRLSHQGGLSGTVATTQTTNLPTAALTRYTSGVGVFACLEITTAVGTTATTATVSYTNSSGTAGRTSPAITFGGTNDRQVNQVQMIPFQVGDVGVRSVESVTLAATTGTAGAFGVTLFRPVAVIPGFDLGDDGMPFDTVKHLGCFFEPLQQDACLYVLHGTNSTSTYSMAACIEIIQV